MLRAVHTPGGLPARSVLLVLDHLDRHAGVGVRDERLQRDPELELVDVELPQGMALESKLWSWSGAGTSVMAFSPLARSVVSGR
jgi:hypothetical protein